MKKMMVAGMVAVTLSLSSPALGHSQTINDQYDDNVTHPLRIAYYLVHPLGYTAEWLIGRPFQYIISREGLRNIFGWQPLRDDGTYQDKRRNM